MEYLLMLNATALAIGIIAGFKILRCKRCDCCSG